MNSVVSKQKSSNKSKIRKMFDSLLDELDQLPEPEQTHDEAFEYFCKRMNELDTSLKYKKNGIHAGTLKNINDYANSDRNGKMEALLDTDGYEKWARERKVDSDDIIICFKKAGRMAIYKPEELVKVFDEYRYTEFLRTETYEFVPANSRQKIIIIGGSDTDNDEFAAKFKSYVIEFLQSKYPDDKIDPSQLIDMRNDSRAELLVNHGYVNNRSEKRDFIASLQSFIIKKKNDEEFAKQIGYNGMECENPAGELYKLPMHKTIETHGYGDYHPLITMITKELGLKNLGATNLTVNMYNNCNIDQSKNTFVNNGNVVNNSKNVDIATHVNGTQYAEITTDMFIEHYREKMGLNDEERKKLENPDDILVLFKHVYTDYTNFCNNIKRTKMTKKQFANYCTDKLVKERRRTTVIGQPGVYWVLM